MRARDPKAARAERLFAVPPRRMIAARPSMSDQINLARLFAVEVVRPEDLVHLTFSFINLRLEAGSKDDPPVLRRRAANRPAFLVLDCHSQHVTELALFERDENYKVEPHEDGRPDDPDTGQPSDHDLPPAPPVFASLSGESRLVFRITNQVIPYTVEGLLDAVTKLDLSVAPHATPPAFKRIPRFGDVFVGDVVALDRLFRRAGSRASAELIALGRMRATAGQLEYRFGTEAALAALSSSRIGSRIKVDGVIGKIGGRVPIELLPPLPEPPSSTQTSIEIPWRLIVSPNRHGAFAHSPDAVEHEGRYELWHTRLGVRAVDDDDKPILDEEGAPTVDERTEDVRTIRAIWARDYEILPAVHDEPKFEFRSPPSGNNFPLADRSQDRPSERMALNSRDRMMLVHETSNFHLRRSRRRWTPEAVPTNRLMLTALGGWLDSRVVFDTLPDGGLTIEEWKHRAALGRDHEVKVVYSGFLLPFGHRASLVKVTERKFKPGAGGVAAYLFQRMFIIVREPEKQFRKDTRALPSTAELPGPRRLDLVMPFGTVRIVTRLTPQLDEPDNFTGTGASGFMFVPHVLGAPFPFKLVAVDLEGNVVEFSAPLVFMERDHNENATTIGKAVTAYNKSSHREFDLRGQRVAFADSEQPDDTILATHSVKFQVGTAGFLQTVPQDEPRFAPVLEEARAVVPAMSALAGASAPTRLAYPLEYAASGFSGNAAQVFLKTLGAAPMNFAGQGDRSGGLVTPSLDVTGLSRLTGPIGGDVTKAITDPGALSVGDFFAGSGISAKLFGLIPLDALFKAVDFAPDKVPKFVTQTLDVATTLKQNVERIRAAAQQHASALGAAATTLKNDADALLADLIALAHDPANPPDLSDRLGDIVADLGPFVSAVEGAPLPRAEKEQLVGIARRIQDQLEVVAEVVDVLIKFAQGLKLPEVVNARLDWSTVLDPWPGSGDDAIFKPLGPGGQGKLTLAVEVQAPIRPGKEPSALVSCSLTPFDLVLIAPVKFLILHFKVIEFSIVPGKKPDVNVQFSDPGGIEFDGPLEFVNTLKDIIPFDGFSDPPYLDVTAEGIKAGFDLPIPDLAVGVFALTNINLGAHFKVPFVDESIETTFNFATRENPFRLQVALFAGGGFFGVTITPERVRVLEAAFEFGAAISVDFGVASGSISVMAGIYFRLETDASGERAQLTGYFRMRGEVDVLGLISASIELYLELTYETSTGKAVGRATLTIEVEVLFFSASVSISCEKKFAGSSGDPSFVDVMGLPTGAPPGAVRPWDVYCRSFADD